FISQDELGTTTKILKKSDASVTNFSFLEEAPLGYDQKELSKYSWIIITSKRTIKYLPKNLDQKISFIACGKDTSKELKKRYKNHRILYPAKSENIEGVKQ